MGTRDDDCAFCQIVSDQTDTEVLLKVSADSYRAVGTLAGSLPDLWGVSCLSPPRFAQDEELLCFRDVKPGAAHHYLVITRAHIDSCKSLQRDDVQLGTGVRGREVLP